MTALTSGRLAAALALALLLAAPPPSHGEDETLGDAYLRVSTSVVVIRRKRPHTRDAEILVDERR